MSTKTVGTKRRKAPKKAGSSTKATASTPECIQTWFDAVLARGVAGLVEEFRVLGSYIPPDLNVSAFRANPEANRYKDVMCLDTSRVVLKGPNGDYIHANFVDGSIKPKQFICAQGPTDATLPQFWRMIYQEQCKLICMLCGVLEKGKVKCAAYWPNVVGSSTTYGAFKVTNTGCSRKELNKGVKSMTEATVTVLEVTSSEGGKPLTVQHWHWPDWPDRGVPPDSKTLIMLRKRMLQNGCPIVVHCSAGIGRTGTLVSLDVLLADLEATPPRAPGDVPTCVKRLRDQRLHSVQNEAQYVFIYRCVIDYIVMKYKIPPSVCHDFYTAHQKLQDASH